MKGCYIMNSEIFKGSCVALVTPFDENGVNFKKLEELIEFQIEKKTDAILICGTTGESSTMTDEEHKATLKFAVEKINKRVPVICGTGSNNTMHAVELSKYAESIGSDAVLLVTPYYNKTTQSGLYEHFKIIAESIKIPCILYNVPGRTSLNIDPDTVVKLSKIENIVALKECNFDQVAEIIYRCDKNFSVYSGNDEIAYSIMALGGKGVISVMANIIPYETHQIIKLYIENKINESKELQFKYINLIKKLFIEVSPIPLKEAMNLLGFEVGKCRLPLTDISSNNKEKLEKVLKEYNLL
jgi:4-hydroxy-tetrahydrodipicolinate synthase